MTAEQFWYENPQDFFAYAEAHKQKLIEQDRMNHILGQYVLMAVAQVANNAIGKNKNQNIYPKTPLLSPEDGYNKSAGGDIKERFSAFAEKFNANFRSKKNG